MKHWTKALLIGAFALAPLSATAAIDNSHHDMIAIGVSSEKCTYCHSVTGLSTTTLYGSVGAFCVTVCHRDGSSVATAQTGAKPGGVVPFSGDFETSAGAFADDTTAGTATNDETIFTTSHNYLKSNIPAPDAVADIAATGWPHTDETSIQCTSCHAVHDNTYSPFLNGALTTGTAGTDFCSRCHTGSAKTANHAGRYGTGTHPVEINYSTRTSGYTLQSTPVPAGSMLVTATGGANMDVDGNSWNLGGHLMTGNTPMAQANATFGCYSCHSAHSNANSNLMMLSAGALRDMCYSCHGGGPATDTGNTQENPGTTSYYHPANTEAPVSILDITGGLTTLYTSGVSAIYKPAAGNSPYCVSCHDVHGGKGTGKALRDVNGTGLVVDFCAECHGAITGHHPVATTTNYQSTMGYPAATPWAGGSLTDGLQCSDCHGVSGSAHNW